MPPFITPVRDHGLNQLPPNQSNREINYLLSDATWSIPT